MWECNFSQCVGRRRDVEGGRLPAAHAEPLVMSNDALWPGLRCRSCRSEPRTHALRLSHVGAALPAQPLLSPRIKRSRLAWALRTPHGRSCRSRIPRQLRSRLARAPRSRSRRRTAARVANKPGPLVSRWRRTARFSALVAHAPRTLVSHGRHAASSAAFVADAPRTLHGSASRGPRCRSLS